MRLRLIVLMLFSSCAFGVSTPNETNNTVSLREYIDLRFSDVDEKLESYILATKDARAIADDLRKQRDIGQNEWRGALEDNNKTLMPRQEAEQVDANITQRLADLDRRVTSVETQRSAFNQGWIIIVALIGVAGGIVGIIVNMRKPGFQQEQPK